MNTIPETSETHYITGRAALNVPNPDGSFAGWHFDEVFLSGRGKLRIAGKDLPDTSHLLGGYGIRECSDVLRHYGVPLAENQKVYSANHVRAILDLVITSLEQHRIPSHVSVYDMLDSPASLDEFQNQLEKLKQKITDKTALTLLQQWEQKQS